MHIQLNTPPPNNTYTYKVGGEVLKKPSANQLSEMDSSIGHRIQSVYENGQKYTPVQKKRLINASVAGVSLAVAAAVTAAVIATGLFPLIVVPVLLVSAGIGTGFYAWLKKEDYDSPEYREKVMDRIAPASLQEIARDYKSDLLIGYKLLDRIAPHHPKNRVEFYARFSTLMNALTELKTWRNQNQNRVSHKFDQETAGIQEWYSTRRQLAHKDMIIRDQQDMIWHQAVVNSRHRNRGRPNRIVQGFALGNHIGNVMSEANDHWQLMSDRSLYDRKIGPWVQWEENEHQAINNAYQQALKFLEEQFREIKTIR